MKTRWVWGLLLLLAVELAGCAITINDLKQSCPDPTVYEIAAPYDQAYHIIVERLRHEVGCSLWWQYEVIGHLFPDTATAEVVLTAGACETLIYVRIASSGPMLTTVTAHYFPTWEPTIQLIPGWFPASAQGP